MKLGKSKLLIVTLVVIACLISIFEVPAYAATAGGTKETAELINLGETVIVNTNGYLDEHYYKLVLKKSGKLKINFVFPKKNIGSADLICADGHEDWWRDIDYSAAGDEYFNYFAYVSAGTYYIKACGTGYFTTSFDAINETYPESLTNKNDSLESAKNISFDKALVGVMADCEYFDYYKFTLDNDAIVSIDGIFNRYDADGEKDDIDAYMYLYDSKAAEKIRKKVIDTDKKLKISDIKLKKGTYYIKLQKENWLDRPEGGFTYKLNLKIKSTMVSSVILNRTSLTIDMLNSRTATLKATVSPSAATNKTIKWSSSNTAVAKVSSDGKVTAVASGTATIYAKSTDGSGKKATCKVTVKGVPYASYTTHVQSYGWLSWRDSGTMSGTSGQGLRLEGIKIKINDKRYSGGIRYTTHVQSYGWLNSPAYPQGWAKNGEMSGTTGQGKRLEAIKIQLYGEMANKYDVYYRVHAQSYGWLGWAKNGAPSGTAGKGKRLEAIQIVLVKKGGKAPANTYKGVTGNTSTAYVQ